MDETKSTIIQARVTIKEKRELEQEAQRLGLSVSELVRMKLTSNLTEKIAPILQAHSAILTRNIESVLKQNAEEHARTNCELYANLHHLLYSNK